MAYRTFDKFSVALEGPANLMASYLTLVNTFGDDVDKAADYVWRTSKAVSKTAEDKNIVRLPGGDVLKLPPVHAVPPEERRSVTDIVRLKPVSLRDASDTVAKTIAPEESVRAMYTENFRDYHESNEKDRADMVDAFIRNMENLSSLPHIRMFEVSLQNTLANVWKSLKQEELSSFKNTFIKSTEKATTPESVLAVFRKLLFKILFKSSYLAVKRKIESTTFGWAKDDFETSRAASVVRKYMSTIIS